MVVRNLLVITGLLLLFSGCLPKQEDVKAALQSNSANSIKSDYLKSQKLLISLKEKLDKRNPDDFSQKLSERINRLLKGQDADFFMKYKDNTLENYKEYLHIAFSKDDIFPRNDYLILGLYYLLHDSYDLNDGYKLTALQYDKKKLHKLYKNLQIIRWKLKVDKDLKDKYLFLTWQNNWQVELEKKLKNKDDITYEDIQNLEFIKNGKETLLDPSNFSFEVLLTKMIDNTRNSLEALGEEPKALSIGAIKGMFLFL